MNHTPVPTHRFQFDSSHASDFLRELKWLEFNSPTKYAAQFPTPSRAGELKLAVAIGVDVGGSGIKGACVDLDEGRMMTERHRIPTPRPATPTSVLDTIEQVIACCECEGPIGCAFPAVVRDGMLEVATNLDAGWSGFSAQQELGKRLKCEVTLVNDADAAGIAEMRFGAGAAWNQRGVVLMLTFGTGIGSALFVDGRLVPNTELGELHLDGHIAETVASGRLREEEIISWEEWIQRVQRYLSHVELLLSPDLIIFGGGISEQHALFLPQLQTRARLSPPRLLNNAGIVGAALAAHLAKA